MASSYKSLKCDCCAGTLEYSKEKKVWVCQYCGNEIRREEEYDGLYTIKNVVKQTLVDIAYNRLDSAQKNLIECEKISSSYVGTLIARISLQMFQLITPGACAEGASKSLMGQLKRNYEALRQIDPGISAEEEALYEMFEGSDDAFGVLLLVFDSLGDSVHKEFVEKLLDAGRVYSVALNQNLLHYSMKNGRDQLTEKILDNVENIDCRQALFLVISDYEDGEKKKEHVQKLIPKARLVADDRRVIENYLKESGDSLPMKACIYCETARAGAAASVECVDACILGQLKADTELAGEVLGAFCSTHPNDAELYYLVEKIYTVHSGQTAVCEIRTLNESGLFLSVPQKVISLMLGRVDLLTEEKKILLEEAEKTEISQRANDVILAEYLCGMKDLPEMRMEIIDAILKYVTMPSTSTVERYILTCTEEGMGKVAVAEKLFSYDLNLSFFRNLLGDYMNQSGDDPEVRRKLEELLCSRGLTVDAAVLVDMACKAGPDTIDETAAFIRAMTANGTKIRSDAFSRYLETAREYYPQILRMFFLPESIVTEQALANYVLYGKEENGVKAQNALIFAERAGGAFGSSPCIVRINGEELRCNLFQAYLLLAPDSEGTVQAITNAMRNARSKLNLPIYLNGAPAKFKKYVTDHREQLKEVTVKICEENKVFSLLF